MKDFFIIGLLALSSCLAIWALILDSKLEQLQGYCKRLENEKWPRVR